MVDIMSEQNNTEPEVINRVLFVDDEPNILSSLKRGLAREKYLKFFALNADEALYILGEHEIHVIVTDMRMPGMNGLDLLKLVSEKYPNVVKIVLSGYTQLPQVLATINQVDIYKFIPKPWNMEEEFIPLIRGAIAHYNMQNDYRKFRNTLEKQNQFYQKLIKQNDEKYNALKMDFDHFNALHDELNKYVSDLLKTPDFQNATAAEIGDHLLSLDGLVKIYASTYPLELSYVTEEKLHAEINAILHLMFKVDEEDRLPYVGTPPTKDAEVLIHIKNDGYTSALTGHFKLYITIQRMVLMHLFALKTPQNLHISQIYNAGSHALITQYEAPIHCLVSSKWELQTALFILRHAHRSLPGKFDIQMSEQSVKVVSIITCKER